MNKIMNKIAFVEVISINNLSKEDKNLIEEGCKNYKKRNMKKFLSFEDVFES